MRNLATVLAVSMAFGLAGMGAASAQLVGESHGVFHVQACGAVPYGYARCHAHIVSDASGRIFTHNVTRNIAPSGYGPSQLRAAYNITGNGSSSTIVAVVDAYGYTEAESNLAVYRSQYGLPACGSGCFTEYSETGIANSYPRATNLGWSQETALDLAMVSAMCPSCKIILIEANSSSYSDLATAVNTAVAKGAHSVGNSYGGSESGTQSFDSAYNHAGVAITASTGDSGYGAGPQFPATSPYVTAVGGTTLTQVSNARGWNETAWSDGGSGCSRVYGQPNWQTSVDSFCPNRTEADVAAVGDPSTGVAVYSPYRSLTQPAWLVFGGTSVSAQVISGIYGVNGGSVTYGENPYQNTNALNDVTSGSNGSCGGSPVCTAGPGFDGPTGLGTPNGATAF